MSGIKVGFLCLWLFGVGVGLALSTTGVATEPEAPPVGAAPPGAVTVIGKVEVVAAEMAGRARTIQIVDAEQRVLIVDDEGPGRALAKHAGETVTATGLVSRRKDGKEVLSVSSFRPLGGS